jgi:predicted trehalose synthase
MATTSPTRIDDDLYASAKAVGKLMSRSAAQQIAHWARIGRELEAADSVSARDIARVLNGQSDYDALGSREQAVVRAEWADRMAQRLADLDLAAEFTATGTAYSELDGRGRATRRQSSKTA